MSMGILSFLLNGWRAAESVGDDDRRGIAASLLLLLRHRFAKDYHRSGICLRVMRHARSKAACATEIACTVAGLLMCLFRMNA